MIPRLRFIKIVSNKSINSGGIEFNPGENLESLFEIFDPQFGQSVEIFNLIPKELHFFAGYEGEDIMFQLRSKPKNQISQKFIFTFTFDDGLLYQVETPVFTVE